MLSITSELRVQFFFARRKIRLTGDCLQSAGSCDNGLLGFTGCAVGLSYVRLPRVQTATQPLPDEI